jgi:hypothetical protein
VRTGKRERKGGRRESTGTGNLEKHFIKNRDEE